MNTHVLIPLCEFEKQISLMSNKQFVSELENLLSLGKKINLDSREVEKAAIKSAPINTPDDPAYPNHSDTDIFIVGYKKLAEDLLEFSKVTIC